MAEHNETGKKGEEMAAEYLTNNGYKILHTNWRHLYYEIDIVATKGKKLHFIEVKTRRSDFYGNPEESVTKRKFKHLKKAADEYLFRNPGHLWIQYDILSIVLKKAGNVEYFLLEDVFI